MIALLWSELLPAYLDFHRDLLFHQEPEVAVQRILSWPALPRRFWSVGT